MLLGPGASEEYERNYGDGVLQIGSGNLAIYQVLEIRAKYSARYKDDGVRFLAVSPGVVDNGSEPGTVSLSIVQTRRLTLASTPGSEVLFQKFSDTSPDFKGPMQPVASVEQILVMEASKHVENGVGGAFISHHGNKKRF